jgi:5-methylcytosine-specific restriction endonuclease McrA
MQQLTGKACRTCGHWLPMSAYQRNKAYVRNTCVSCQSGAGCSHKTIRCRCCMLDKPHWSVATNGYCMTCRSRYLQDRRDGRSYNRPCDWCGSNMDVSYYRLKLPAAFCSRACKDRRKNQARAESLVLSKPTDRSCPHCGTRIAQSRRKDAVYCSRACNSAAHHATRKARMKITVDGEVVRIPRAYIIERDNSRCHMCNRKCSGTNLHIDHVIPLSRGGTHTLENLRVACATCNTSKRDRAVGEQLMLVG